MAVSQIFITLMSFFILSRSIIVIIMMSIAKSNLFHELKGGKPRSFKSIPQTLPSAEYGEISTETYPGDDNDNDNDDNDKDGDYGKMVVTMIC